MNRNGSTVYSAPDATEIYSDAVIGQINASQVNFLQDATGAVTRTVQNRLEDTVCVFDFMTLAQINDVKNGTLLIDTTASIDAALASGSKNVYFPQGQYKTTATINRPNLVRMFGDGAFQSTIVAYHNNSIIKTGSGVPGGVGALVGDAYNSMEDMGVKNGPTFNSAIGIELLNLNQPSFKRIRIESGPIVGIRLLAVLNGIFEELTVVDCSDVGIYLYSTDLGDGNNRNVFRYINNSYCNLGIVVDSYGGLQNVFSDVAVEGSLSYPVQISNCFQLLFERLYLEGNAQSINVLGGEDIIFRDCFNVSAIPFIRVTGFNGVRTLVDRLYDLSGGGVGANGTIMRLSQGQIQFPSTAIISTNANTLDDYEEGAWSPADASGAGLVLTNGVCRYTKIGRVVTANFNTAYPVNANGTTVAFGGLPFSNKGNASVNVGFTSSATVARTGITEDESTYSRLYSTSNVALLNSDLSGVTIRGTIVYETDV
jgi:hypothetical protein